MNKQILDQLKNDSNFRKVKDGFVISSEEGSFHIFDAYSEEDLKGISKEESFYLAFCSKEEIIQLRDVRTSEDYLLWMQAEAIVDNPRLIRVFRKRRKRARKWSLSIYYKKHLWLKNKYLTFLSKGKRNKLSKLPTGLAYLDETNAMCLKSPYGNLVLISEPLKYFLYFMNIFFWGENFNIDWEDRSSALLIALRLILGSESYDFDLDPRCNLPVDVEHVIEEQTNNQLLFVLGHEFAHHLLGHLKSSCLKSTRLSDLCYNSNCKEKIKRYNYNFKLEYDADAESIKMITKNKQIREHILNSAFNVFLYFHIAEAVREHISPTSSSIKSHPNPIDRLIKLRKKTNNKIGYTANELENQIEFTEGITKQLVEEFIPFNIEVFDFYGSVYLPSYKKNMMIDRIDF